MRPIFQPTIRGSEATALRKNASLTGSIAGARSERGNKSPTVCMRVRSGVLGAKVKTIEPRHLAAKDYGLARERNRVFIVGVRHCVLNDGVIPQPLQPFGRTPPGEFLNLRLPPTPREARTSHMKRNLKDYEDTVRNNVKRRVLDASSIVFFFCS